MKHGVDLDDVAVAAGPSPGLGLGPLPGPALEAERAESRNGSLVLLWPAWGEQRHSHYHSKCTGHIGRSFAGSDTGPLLPDT